MDLRFGLGCHVGVKLKLKFEEVQSLLLKYQHHRRRWTNRIDYLELNPLGRLGIAIRLVRVFAFMHNSPIGKRINCDMTKVTRALSLVFKTLQPYSQDIHVRPILRVVHSIFEI